MEYGSNKQKYFILYRGSQFHKRHGIRDINK